MNSRRVAMRVFHWASGRIFSSDCTAGMIPRCPTNTEPMLMTQ